MKQLSANEVRQLLSLSKQFTKRFAGVAQAVLMVAHEEKINERVARLSIATECLLLSAFMWDGDPETFVDAARAALNDAARSRAADRDKTELQ